MPDPFDFPAEAVKNMIKTALEEDLGGQKDVTSWLLIPGDKRGTLALNPRHGMVASGMGIPELVFEALGAEVKCTRHVPDGSWMEKGQTLVTLEGSAQALLTGERVTLNLMQRACAVATLTRKYVETISGTKARVLDTRKTMPGLRALDKYAVRCGGGGNHRMGLYDTVMIKDNHVALAGGIAAAVAAVRKGTKLPIVLECDTLEQVEEALLCMPDKILLDNMDTASLRDAVEMTAGRIPLEASGGVTLETVRAIAETGVDFISVGALTHSALAVDIGADIVIA